MGWLQGWNYRKSHEIEGSSAGAVTNYQVKVKVHYGSGSDSGEDVYLNEHCRTDFGDVRFTSSDGETLLDYWMEEKVDGDYAIFWVEVDSIPASPDTKTIYIYYGNPDATSISNGEATFPFFDDFDVDLSKWTTISGTWSISDSLLVSPSGDDTYIRTATYTMDNAAIRTKLRVTASTGCFASLCSRFQDTSNYYRVEYTGPEYDKLIIWKRVGGTHTGLGDVIVVGDLEFHKIDFILNGSSLKAIFDDTDEVSATDETFSSGYIAYRKGGNSGDFRVDWILVRNYVDPEPSHGAWGSEETYVAPIPIPIPVIVLPEPTYAKYFIPPQGLKYRRSVNKPPQG